MKRSLTLAIAFVGVAIGGIALGPPMLSQPPQADSNPQSIDATSPSVDATSPSVDATTIQKRPPSSTPNQYLIVLDVSGSMSWNISGEGTLQGENVNCEWGGPSKLRYKPGCTGPSTPWGVESERRIYLAKEMIGNLIDGMQPKDKMEIIAFTSGVGYQGNTHRVPVNGWTSDQAQLKADLLAVGSYSSQTYVTNGGSANAQAMLKAQDALASAPDGSSYRTVVMLVADGPANVFANGRINPAIDICSDVLGGNQQFVARCHIGYSEKYQSDRPITQMIKAADELKAQYKVDLYTINMSNNDDDFGMADVASNPAMAYRYIGPSMLSDMMNQGQH